MVLPRSNLVLSSSPWELDHSLRKHFLACTPYLVLLGCEQRLHVNGRRRAFFARNCEAIANRPEAIKSVTGQVASHRLGERQKCVAIVEPKRPV